MGRTFRLANRIERQFVAGERLYSGSRPSAVRTQDLTSPSRPHISVTSWSAAALPMLNLLMTADVSATSVLRPGRREMARKIIETPEMNDAKQ